MLAPIILTLGGFFLLRLLGSCVRRAIPLAVASAGGWLVFAQSGEVGTALLVGFGLLCATTFVLDELADWTPARPFLIVAEAIAGACLVMTLTFAVFGSAGVEGAALVSAILVSGIFAATVTLRFRRAV
jgi:hypothetical protein